MLSMAPARGRAETCRRSPEKVLASLAPLAPQVNGDPERTLPHVLNLSIPGVDSEAAISEPRSPTLDLRPAGERTSNAQG